MQHKQQVTKRNGELETFDIEKLHNEEVSINDALELISNYSKAKSVKKAVYQNYIKQLG